MMMFVSDLFILYLSLHFRYTVLNMDPQATEAVVDTSPIKPVTVLYQNVTSVVDAAHTLISNVTNTCDMNGALEPGTIASLHRSITTAALHLERIDAATTEYVRACAGDCLGDLQKAVSTLIDQFTNECGGLVAHKLGDLKTVLIQRTSELAAGMTPRQIVDLLKNDILYLHLEVDTRDSAKKLPKEREQVANVRVPGPLAQLLLSAGTADDVFPLVRRTNIMYPTHDKLASRRIT